MKKLVLAMACVLSLALLASCKQEAASSDVTVSNQVANQSYSYKGTVSGSFVRQTTNTAGDAYVAATSGTAVAVIDNTWGYSEVYWTVEMGSNYQDYTLSLALATNTGATNAENVSVPTSFTIYKLGDKYYCDDVDLTAANDDDEKKSEIKFKDGGSPEDSEFTIESLGYKTLSSNVYLLKDVKFTRLDD